MIRLEKEFTRLARSLGTLLLLSATVRNVYSMPPPSHAILAGSISLNTTTILVDHDESSYVQYGVKDLSSYLSEITGNAPTVVSSLKSAPATTTLIVIGQKMALATNPDLKGAIDQLDDQGFILRSSERSGRTTIIAAGSASHGTNFAIASLMQQIHSEGRSAYLAGSINQNEEPFFQSRGLHLNGWPLKYPYAFRAWKEEDWKHFVDIAWIQKVNLLFIWPFMDIIPMPLSDQDEAYLKEVSRVVEYAKKQRGMQVWIMQSANRIGTSDCGTADPRFRAYWVMDKCQKDMNPSDSAQFAKITESFQGLYTNVPNPDAFVFIDNDPGGWPNSPLDEQTKIFSAARSLVDKYSTRGRDTKLIDWMWLGWGYPNSPIDDPKKREDFFAETIQNFKANLSGPWELLAGNTASLNAAKRESMLKQTTFIPYGAVEEEPSFPFTNTGMVPVKNALDVAAQYPDLKGVMGNNELMLLQLPRTSYFLRSSWDRSYEAKSDAEVYRDLAEQLYPENSDLIAEAIGALNQDDPDKIGRTLQRLRDAVEGGKLGRPGAIGRYLFPDSTSVARILIREVEIQQSRQTLVHQLADKPAIANSENLLEDYFDKLLSWNQDTGWNKMLELGIWTDPIYRNDPTMSRALISLRHSVDPNGNPVTDDEVNALFARVSIRLLAKYDKSSVMIGCITPMKNETFQSR